MNVESQITAIKVNLTVTFIRATWREFKLSKVRGMESFSKVQTCKKLIYLRLTSLSFC